MKNLILFYNGASVAEVVADYMGGFTYLIVSDDGEAMSSVAYKTFENYVKSLAHAYIMMGKADEYKKFWDDVSLFLKAEDEWEFDVAAYIKTKITLPKHLEEKYLSLVDIDIEDAVYGYTYEELPSVLDGIIENVKKIIKADYILLLINEAARCKAIMEDIIKHDKSIEVQEYAAKYAEIESQDNGLTDADWIRINFDEIYLFLHNDGKVEWQVDPYGEYGAELIDMYGTYEEFIKEFETLEVPSDWNGWFEVSEYKPM